MSQVPALGNDPAIKAGAMPPLTWPGTLSTLVKTATHYLHLAASPCEKCNGPVIAGSLGTRYDDISRETDFREIGAVCLVCGFRPGTVPKTSVKHQFRPVEWNWAIRDHAQPVGSSDDQLATELSQDADGKL